MTMILHRSAALRRAVARSRAVETRRAISLADARNRDALSARALSVLIGVSAATAMRAHPMPRLPAGRLPS